MCAVAESFVRKIKQEHEGGRNNSHNANYGKDKNRVEPDIQRDSAIEQDQRGVTFDANRMPDSANSNDDAVPVVDGDEEASLPLPAGKTPFDWGFKFNPRVGRLRVTNTRGENIFFHNKGEALSFIEGIKDRLDLWGEDNQKSEEDL